jgi:hypothetical protein
MEPNSRLDVRVEQICIVPRKSAQATAPAANAGIVMPPERRRRKPAHATITGATSSVPVKFEMTHTRNVGPPQCRSADVPCSREDAAHEGKRKRAAEDHRRKLARPA